MYSCHCRMQELLSQHWANTDPSPQTPKVFTQVQQLPSQQAELAAGEAEGETCPGSSSWHWSDPTLLALLCALGTGFVPRELLWQTLVTLSKTISAGFEWVCCISHEQTQSCWESHRCEPRQHMVTVPPAWPFFLKIPFCSQVFDKPFSHCCCLVTGRVAFPRDRDLGPVCSEADLEGLFFEGSSFCGRCWRFSLDQQELPRVWDGAVGGEEERRQQEKPRIRGKWFCLNANMQKTHSFLASGRGKIKYWVRVSELSRNPQDLAGPLQPPLGSVHSIKPGVKLKGVQGSSAPAQQEQAIGKPAPLLTGKDRKSSKMETAFWETGHGDEGQHGFERQCCKGAWLGIPLPCRVKCVYYIYSVPLRTPM